MPKTPRFFQDQEPIEDTSPEATGPLGRPGLDILRQDSGGTVKDDDNPGCGELVYGPTRLHERFDGPPIIDVYYVLKIYERCAIIKFVDKNIVPIPGSSIIRLDKTAEVIVGGKTIVGYAGHQAGTIIYKAGPDILKKWARWVSFTIKGCTDKFAVFQFMHEVKKITPGGDPIDQGWQPDPPGGGAYPGILKPAGPISGGFLDYPGFDGVSAKNFGPNEKIKKDNGTDKRSPVVEGDTYTDEISFESYICCAGERLGYYSWSTTLTSTYRASSGWSDPSQTSTDFTWNPDPTKGQNSNKFTCPKSP